MATVTARTSSPSAVVSWKQALRDAIRDPEELIRRLRLPETLLEPARRAARRFPLLVSRDFVARMRPEDPDDPLLRQVLPLDLEERDVADFTRDPVGDGPATRLSGLIQKYRGRALLVTANACAAHCRFCFRRHFPYASVPRDAAAWEPAIAAIAADTSLHEIILSGGDPLVLDDRRLARLVHRIEAIPHVRRLRLHTRLPILVPSRVDDRLLAWLSTTRLTPWVVVHVNHPHEIDTRCADALLRLTRGGIPALSQTVLLRGVNDATETLARLCERLIDVRVTPYYLHQLDPVAGAAHFHVPPDRGRTIMKALRERLPGYAVPKYVREHAGAAHKIEIT